MTVFGPYARYYDLLYRDKDYQGETSYVNSLVQTYFQGASSLLDIGCGTGRHSELFSRMGFDVKGLDRSENMISRAKKQHDNIQFHHADVCNFQLGEKFEVIVALFHVFSYLTTDAELQSALQRVRNHLAPGGIFIFDCWHGPAVLSQVPEIRIKRLENANTRLVRVAEPKMIAEENKVDVNFQVFVQEDDVWDEFSETHSMRYLFQPEIAQFLSSSRMQLLHAEEWLTKKKPGEETWSVVYVARAS